MDSVKVTDRLPVDYEVALILLQMASGLSEDELDKVYELPEDAKEFMKIPITKGLTTVKCETNVPSVDIVKSTSKKACPIKEEIVNNVEVVPARKRGRPSTSKTEFPPAKYAKMMAVAVKKEEATSSDSSNVESLSPNTNGPNFAKANFGNMKSKKKATKWQALQLKNSKYVEASQLRERRVLETLRTFLMDQPSDSYQPKFLQKLVQNV